MPVVEAKESTQIAHAQIEARRAAAARQARETARAELTARNADTTSPLKGMPEATLPDPPVREEATPAPEKAAEPLTLNAVHGKLCKPFAASLVELKPGAVTQDRKRALGMPFVDSRAYQTRLDRVVGPEGWAVEYRPLSDRAVLCRLTILSVTREDVGECNASDENAATSAVAQSFKRACAAFGLGRYLYSLPQIWGEFDADKKRFVDPAHLVQQMYAGLPKSDE